MTRIPIVVPLCVCAGVMLAGSGCGSNRAAAAAAPDLVVPVARIATGDLRQVLTIPAEFHPYLEVDLHAKVAGFLKSIAVDVGDRVQAGQPIAVLEIPELEAEMTQDAAAVRRAQEEINRAQADLARAESAHDVAHAGATRLANVSKARPALVAQQDVDEVTGRDRTAEAQVATAQASLAAARAQLEMAQAGAQRTQTLVDYAQITAPFAGVITRRYADPGAMIQAGTSSQTQAMPVVTLSQNSRLRLVVAVPESAVARIRPGAAVDLSVDALHRTFQGTVARVADRVDTDTRTMRVEVDVQNPTLELVPGMYATASIVLAHAEGVLIAPPEALDRDGDVTRVLVVKADRRVEPRQVTIGLETTDGVQIVSGVSAGDLLVTGSRAQLQPGTIVTPAIAAPRPPAGGAR